MIRLFLLLVGILLINLTSNFSNAGETKKLRDDSYQLASDSISINIDEHIRIKRHPHPQQTDLSNYGRNPPPSTVSSDGYEQGPPIVKNNFVQPQQIGRQRIGTPLGRNTLNPVANVNGGFNQGYNPSSIVPRRPILSNNRQGNTVSNTPNVPRPYSPSDGEESLGLNEHKATKYYYPPRMPLPLPECFHNPTGYVCCNRHLNDLIVDTYTELEAHPKFHTCNINALATHLQTRAEKRFNTSFETIASFEDFAQKIHFNGNLACKVELNGKYMLAYATVKNVEQYLPPEDLIGPQPERPRHHISRRYSMFI